MADLSQSTDADLINLTAQIKEEQARRAEIKALQQDAKVASEQIVSVTKTLQAYGAGNQFEILKGLLPEDFIDWVAFGGGTQRNVWKQPIDSSSTYQAGDIVVYQGQIYKSLVGDNSFSPTDAPNLWQLI